MERILNFIRIKSLRIENFDASSEFSTSYSIRAIPDRDREETSSSFTAVWEYAKGKKDIRYLYIKNFCCKKMMKRKVEREKEKKERTACR